MTVVVSNTLYGVGGLVKAIVVVCVDQPLWVCYGGNLNTLNLRSGVNHENIPRLQT